MPVHVSEKALACLLWRQVDRSAIERGQHIFRFSVPNSPKSLCHFCALSHVPNILGVADLEPMQKHTPHGTQLIE